MSASHLRVNGFTGVSVCMLASSPYAFVCAYAVPGSARGGEHGPEHHPGGGEGAQSQRQCAGPDAFPGGSSTLPVKRYTQYHIWSLYQLN